VQVRARHVRASRARGFPLLSPYSIDARSNASQSASVIPTNGAVIVVVGFGRVVANARIVIGASEFARVLHVVGRSHVTSLVRVVDIVRSRVQLIIPWEFLTHVNNRKPPDTIINIMLLTYILPTLMDAVILYTIYKQLF
jgi:hypothetical protein